MLDWIAVMSSALVLATAPAIDAGERRHCALLVVGPNAPAAEGAPEAIVAAAAAAANRSAGFAVESAERAGVQIASARACAGRVRFSCWARSVGEGAESPAFLLILAIHPAGPAVDRVLAVLLDVETARVAIGDSDPDDPRRLEDRIFDSSYQTKPAMLDTADPAAMQAYFQELFGVQIADWATGDPRFQAPGTILLRLDAAGIEVDLDGRSLGHTSASESSITGVQPGLRRLALRPDDGDVPELQQTVDVRAGRTATVSAALAPTRIDDRPFMLLAGIVAGLAGTGIATYAAVVQPEPSGRIELCTGGRCEPSRDGFASFCDLGGGSDCGGSVLAAPLGFGLAATGAALSIGSAVLAERSAWWWLPPLIGVAAAGAAYGISAAADSL